MLRSSEFKFLIMSVLVMVFLYVTQSEQLIVDENPHVGQIWSLLKGDDTHQPYITTFIVFHKMYVFFIELFDITDHFDYRLISFFFSGLLILSLLLNAKEQGEPFNWMMASQILFLPIALPYYPLIYTDIIALMLLMFAYLFFQKGQHVAVALLAAGSVLIRQPSLVWLGLFATLLFFDHFKFQRHQFLKAALKTWPYVITVVGFFIYFYLNQGIALGDKDRHHVSLNVTNLYFFLLVFLMSFLPLLISRFFQVMDLVKRHKWVLIVLLVLLPVYLYTFAVTHHYNAPWLNMFIRNWLLNTINDSMALKTIAYVVSSYTVLAIVTIPFKQLRWRWLYVFIPLSFLAMPLIEQRYYIVGMVLWLLNRELTNRTVEIIQLLWMAGCSLLIYWGVANDWFYF